MESNKHIFLIGMMGTGKTTVGRKLADRLAILGSISISSWKKILVLQLLSIFIQRYGEEAFRQQESHMLQKLVHQSPSVITTGGGFVLGKKTARLW